MSAEVIQAVSGRADERMKAELRVGRTDIRDFLASRQADDLAANLRLGPLAGVGQRCVQGRGDQIWLFDLGVVAGVGELDRLDAGAQLAEAVEDGGPGDRVA